MKILDKFENKPGLIIYATFSELCACHGYKKRPYILTG